MNAVEREPVPTGVLNPNASEASYEPKRRSYRRTDRKKKVLAPDSPGAEMSSTKTAAPNRRRRVSGAETYPTRISMPNLNVSLSSPNNFSHFSMQSREINGCIFSRDWKKLHRLSRRDLGLSAQHHHAVMFGGS